MKKIILLAAFCIPAFIVSGQETDTPEPLARTIFKLSPQHFVQNSLKAGVERFNPNHSASLAFYVTGMIEHNNYLYEEGGYSGLAGELQLRKYISPMKIVTSRRGKTYHQGIYGAAYVQGGSYSGDFQDQYGYWDPNTGMYVQQVNYAYKDRVWNWGLGFTIGYQKTLWQVLFMEAFVGGGIQFSDRNRTGTTPAFYNDNDYGISSPGYKGILPKIGVQIGIGL